MQEKKSLNAIAHAINVSESTVCREIKRHPDWGNRYHFKLDPDGYFRMVDMKEKITIEKMYVNDSDGYVNVRKEMSTNSEVLYKLKNDVGVYVWLMPNSNWAEVIPIYKEKRGYIHKSRLK